MNYWGFFFLGFCVLLVVVIIPVGLYLSERMIEKPSCGQLLPEVIQNKKAA